MLDNEYCSVRGMGAFLSQLVMDYHARKTRQLTQAEIAQELHRLASLVCWKLGRVMNFTNQWCKLMWLDSLNGYPTSVLKARRALTESSFLKVKSFNCRYC